jgi:hypothetical protein
VLWREFAKNLIRSVSPKVGYKHEQFENWEDWESWQGSGETIGPPLSAGEGSRENDRKENEK